MGNNRTCSKTINIVQVYATIKTPLIEKLKKEFRNLLSHRYFPLKISTHLICD